MAKDSVDARKLKDSAAEYLKKSKFEKAAEILEQLVQAEPKDVQHRFRLGDCYRKLAQPQKSIAQYDAAGRYYADQGQLIKAIAAVKVILEIDPRNAEAQKQLAEMNERRMSKGAPDSAGRAGGKAAAIGRIAPAKAARDDVADGIELPDEPQITKKDPPAPTRGAQRGAMVDRIEVEEAADDGDSLELDDSPKNFSPGYSERALIPPPPEAHSGSPEGRAEIEDLPDDAILEAEPEDLAANPDDDEVVTAPLEPTRPIADLLGSDVEEEIELLSVSTDRGEEPEVEASGQDLEAAFGAILPGAKAAPRKVPARVPLFDDLPRDAFVELVNRLSYRRYGAGEQILKEGEPGRSFFVIVEGKVRIWKKLPDGEELQLATLGEGAFFGEMALLSGAPRTANVSAEEDTELLEVGSAVLRHLARNHPLVIKSLKNFYRQRLLSNVMAISPLFKDFDPAERRQLVEKFKLRQAAPGEMLIKEGAQSDGLYVVLHGSVDVAAQQIDLAHLREGEIFGEMSLLTRQPATATVVSPGNAILLRLPRDQFQELVVTHPQILALVSELTEQRAAATRAALEKHGISSFV
ncbi:MAG TPA: cyclic nucleotide-binding domain-containing protein [Myxococcales bacterium]